MTLQCTLLYNMELNIYCVYSGINFGSTLNISYRKNAWDSKIVNILSAKNREKLNIRQYLI